MTNMDKLYEAVAARGPVCVGLDTDFSYLPADFVDTTLTKGENIVRFNKKLIDATKAVAGCYKVQIAYYESLGLEGMKAYAETLAAVREAGIPVIADIKRGDIAKTAEECVTALQNFKCFTHCSSPSLFYEKYLLNGIVPRFCSNCKFMRKFSLYTHKLWLFWYISSIIQHFGRSRGSPPAFSRRGHPSTVPSRRQWSPWRGGWQSLPRPPVPPWHLP